MTKVSVRKFKESLLAYLFLLPALVVLSVFTFWPVGFSFVLSFFKWDFRNMKSPYFYGLGNYKEVLKFDYPVKFPFHLGLIYSFMYIAISILIVFAIFGVIDIFRKKRVEGSTLLSIISIITYFVVKNNVSPLFVLIFDVVLYILIFVLFKTKVPDRNLMTEHAWLAAA
ncbi:MAG: sugar ABC transporter permease, partial [Fervidobacterium sp.]